MRVPHTGLEACGCHESSRPKGFIHPGTLGITATAIPQAHRFHAGHGVALRLVNVQIKDDPLPPNSGGFSMYADPPDGYRQVLKGCRSSQEAGGGTAHQATGPGCP